MVGFGEYLLKILLPLYSFAIDVISTELQVESISLASNGSTKQILAVVTNPSPLHVSSSVLPAGIPIQLSTLQGHSLQHFIVIYSILLAYICGIDKKKYKLLLTSIPFYLAVEFIDIPLVLLGSGYDLIYSNLAPDLISGSIQIMAMDFLNGGGRIALSIFAAVCSIGTYKFISNGHYNYLLLLLFSNAKQIKI